ncbi:MAG: 50S ribosomal protein L11 methyltransferase [Myxococcales bacterium]
MESRAIRFSRLIISVPRALAEAYGAALVEAGVGAIEEREVALTAADTVAGAVADARTVADAVAVADAGTVEIVVTVPDESSLDDLESLARAMYAAFAEQLDWLPKQLRVRRETCELDYHAGWLERVTRQALTDRVVFIPTTDTAAAPEGMRSLYFEPHPSFGDGSHSTTRLAAHAVERYCLTHPGCLVFDVGAGNGVLSLVAAVSGAQHVLGIDLDHEAVATAIKNAERNALSSRCSFETQPIEAITSDFDLVVANLEPRTQIELSDLLASRVNANGSLILTGFLCEQTASITASLPILGFTRVSRAEAEGFALEHWQAPPTRFMGNGGA